MSECEKYLTMLSAQADGELSPNEKRELEKHLETCPPCRKAKEAFEAISKTLDHELVQPPETLAASVMRKIKESDPKGEVRENLSKIKETTKKSDSRRINITRCLAVAACAALILFSAQRSMLPGTGSGNSAMDRSMAEFEQDAEPQAANYFDADDSEASDGSAPEAMRSSDSDDKKEAGTGEPASRPAATSEPEPKEPPPPEPDSMEGFEGTSRPMESEGAVTSNVLTEDTADDLNKELSALFSSCTVSLYDAPAPEPYYSFVSSEDAANLLSLIGSALTDEDETAQTPDSTPLTVIRLSDGSTSYSVTVWISGDNIVCLYSGGPEDMLYTTDGSPEILTDYIAALKELALPAS